MSKKSKKSKKSTEGIYQDESDNLLMYAYYTCVCACARNTPIPFSDKDWFKDYKACHDLHVLACEIEGKKPIPLGDFGWVAEKLIGSSLYE